MDAITVAALGVLIGLALGPWVHGPALAWVLAAIGVGLLGVGRRRWPVPAGVAAIGLGLASARSLPPGPAWSGAVSVIGVRVGAPLGRVADVRVARWARPGGAWSTDGGRIRVRFPDRPPASGTPLVLFGHAGPVPRALPGAPDPVRAAALSRIRTQVRAERVSLLRRAPVRGPPHDATGLLAAVALGDRSGVSRDTLTLLRRTGTAHLLAISGFHVGVLAALAAGIALGALRAVAAPSPRGWPTQLAAALGVCAAWIYATVAGAPLSALRAAGLLGLVALGRAAGRRPNLVPLLGIVAVGIAIGDPSAMATPGFQLSFGAVLGLVVIGGRLAAHVPAELPWPAAWVANGIIATVASTLGTLPAAAWWFQEVAPMSAPANLIAMPVMGFGVVPMAAAACWAPAPLNNWAATLGTGTAELLLTVLAPLAWAPWTPAVGPVGALLLAGALLVGLVRWWGGVVLGAVVLGGRAPRGERITVLDVGQGDAIVVEYADGRTWLVDGGPRPGAVLGWLRRQGIRHIDVVVATHGEWDHYAGLLPVLTELQVGELWAVAPPERLQEAAASGGVPIRWPEEALWPLPGALPERENDRSIVLGVGPMLLTGDLEARAERRLGPQLRRPFPVLKVGHHGSATSTSASWLDLVEPAVAIVSVGADNRYGHPHPSVLARLERAGVTLWRTDRHGTIELLRTEQGWCVRVAIGPAGCLPTTTGTPRPPR